uniref:Oxidative stress-responsive protein 1 n=1 Tax=Panagrolaimus sp. JU765 TaxID=591449 RepID=A0AC34R9Y6_9BILA
MSSVKGSSTSVTTIETIKSSKINGIPSEVLVNKLELLSIGKNDDYSNISTQRSTSIKEISNCYASCSHEKLKKFRPKKVDIRETLLKASDSSTIKKKSISPKPNTNFQGLICRPRAKSVVNCLILQGTFGPICRKMFVQKKRRKSFTISSNYDYFDQKTTTTTITTDQSLKKPCGQEANLPECPQNVENGEIDELAEYFEHFVNVRLKMSAQAESMYV